MATWKLSINPGAERGFDAFALCRDLSLLGVGWSYIFDGRSIASKEQSYAALAEQGGIPRPIQRLLDEVQVGDFVWLHQRGAFYLCRVTSEEAILGPAITPEFRKFDLGHARQASWVKVPHRLVTGRVQRSTIAQRTIQAIACSADEEQTYAYIHAQLTTDPAWLPAIDLSRITTLLAAASPDVLRALLSPDDYEDIVAALLQASGWTLVKSSCFRSKPTFEFIMAQPGPRYAHVQVKSGNVQLMPEIYKDWVQSNESVYLFSAHPNPYPGSPVPGVTPLHFSDLLPWCLANPWALSPGLLMNLQVSAEAALGVGD